jgi:hypothetical protein
MEFMTTVKDTPHRTLFRKRMKNKILNERSTREREGIHKINLELIPFLTITYIIILYTSSYELYIIITPFSISKFIFILSKMMEVNDDHGGNKRNDTEKDRIEPQK